MFHTFLSVLSQPRLFSGGNQHSRDVRNGAERREMEQKPLIKTHPECEN